LQTKENVCTTNNNHELPNLESNMLYQKSLLRNKNTGTNMKKQLLPLIIIVLLLPIVTATFTNEWGEYQDDYTNRGFVGDERAYFETGKTQLTIAQGSNFQALLIDADNDGNTEGIGSNGNYAIVWSIATTGITETASASLGAAQTTQHTALPATFDGDDYTEWLTIHGTNISVLEYNGTSLNIQCSNTTLTTTIYSGIRCKNITGTTACYWTTDGGNITEFNPLTCGITQYNIASVNLFNTAKQLTPIIEDIDNDGSQNIITTCRNATLAESICSIEQTSMTLEWRTQISGASGTNELFIGNYLVYPMSADSSGYEECIDAYDFAYPLVNVPIIGLIYKPSYNSCVNGCGFFIGTGTYGGSNKIVLSYHASGGHNEFVQDGYMMILNNDGSTSSNTMVFDDGGSANFAYAGGVTITNFNDSFNTPACSLFQISATAARLYCIDYSGTKVFETSNLDSSLIPSATNLNTPAARMLSNSTYYQLIKGSDIIELTSPSTIKQHNISTGSRLTGSTSLADVNNDLSLDVCVQNTNLFTCILATITDLPPTIYNNYTYGGYGNDLSTYPVCLNSSVNFNAQECGGTNTDCNYDNDLEENIERLVSNCGHDSYGSVLSGYDTFLVYGDYARSNPTFSCYYNTTGTFSVRIYLQDEANNETYSSYNNQAFSVTVIDGEPGVSCDVARISIVPAVTLSGGTSENDAFLSNWDDALEDFGIISQTAKSMIWLILMIALAFLIFSVYKGESVVYIIAFMEVIMLVLGWVLGMIGTVPLVIVGLFAALLLTFMWMKNPAGG